MRVILCNNYDEMSVQGAKLVASQLMLKPDSVIGFATGSTPVGLYKRLIEMYKAHDVDFSHSIGFNLDEYYPISADNPQSYHYFMKKNLFDHINIKRSFIPDGSAKDPEKECRHYEKLIEEHGGIDLQILGIGQNGHIGFNEPDNTLNTETHLTKLTQSTIEANSRFFDSIDEVPTHAITMGISTILKSKKIILLASGKNKHAVVKELLTNDINTNLPATMLKVHPDVVLIIDEEAFDG
mgnify:FL=1